MNAKQLLNAYHKEHDKVSVFEGRNEVIGDGRVSGHEENDKRHKPQKHELPVPAITLHHILKE